MNDQEKPLLLIKDLHIRFAEKDKKISVVNGVDLELRRRHVLGLVGESGCGKSVTSLAILGLLPKKSCTVEGEILFEGRDLLKFPETEMRGIRGDRIAMVFQEPMTSLNPVFTIGNQIGEAIRIHQGCPGKEKLKRCVEALKLVSIPDPRDALRCYPHQLSGGMRQRVMIAMALCCKPDLIIADEPTTALDVTIQAQVLDLFKSVKERLGTAMIFISHDLGVIAEIADDVAVLYAGYVMEECSVMNLFNQPLHPYTVGLMNSRSGNASEGEKRLPSIPGMVPNPGELPPGCPFAPRCSKSDEICRSRLPELIPLEEGHKVRCWKAARRDR